MDQRSEGNPGGKCVRGSAAMVGTEAGGKLGELGVVFVKEWKSLSSRTPMIKTVRGKGLLNAIVINDTPDSTTAWDICISLMDRGLLAKPTHGNIIRLAPPLVITEEQIHECCDIIENVFLTFKP